MKLKPKRERVIVQKFPEEETTPGGLILPDLCREKPTLGYVLDVGPGYMTRNGFWFEPPCKIDDIVVFPKYSGANVNIKGKEFFVISSKELLGVVNTLPDSEHTPFSKFHEEFLKKLRESYELKPEKLTQTPLTPTEPVRQKAERA